MIVATPGLSDGQIASVALELFDALELLVAKVHEYKPESCAHSEPFREAEDLLAKYKDSMAWLGQQGS